MNQKLIPNHKRDGGHLHYSPAPEHPSTLTEPPRNISLLVNTAAGTSRSAAPLVPELASELDATAVTFIGPGAPGTIASAVYDALGTNTSTLAVIGGDGTLRAVAAAMVDLALPHSSIPDIAVLDGGTMGLLAAAAGANHGWRRVAAARSIGTRPSWFSIRTPILRVNGVAGFVLGFGFIAALSREFQQQSPGRPGGFGSWLIHKLPELLADPPLHNSRLPLFRVAQRPSGTAEFECSGGLATAYPALVKRMRGDSISTNSNGLMNLFQFPGTTPPAVSLVRTLLPHRDHGAFRLHTLSIQAGMCLQFSQPVEIMVDGEHLPPSTSLEIDYAGSVRLWFPRMTTFRPAWLQDAARKIGIRE